MCLSGPQNSGKQVCHLYHYKGYRWMLHRARCRGWVLGFQALSRHTTLQNLHISSYSEALETLSFGNFHHCLGVFGAWTVLWPCDYIKRVWANANKPGWENPASLSVQILLGLSVHSFLCAWDRTSWKEEVLMTLSDNVDYRYEPGTMDEDQNMCVYHNIIMMVNFLISPSQ
jgi:hypothetical protein